MKKIFYSIIILSLVSFTSMAQEKWGNLSSDTGRFSVDFSGDIEQSTRETETASSFKIAITSGEMNYMVSSTKHQYDLEDEVDNLLNVSIKSFEESVNATVVSKQEVTRNDASGIYADMIFSEGTVRLEYFVFIKGKYQYQVMSYANKEYYNEEDANRFFRSFTILE